MRDVKIMARTWILLLRLIIGAVLLVGGLFAIPLSQSDTLAVLFLNGATVPRRPARRSPQLASARPERLCANPAHSEDRNAALGIWGRRPRNNARTNIRPHPCSHAANHRWHHLRGPWPDDRQRRLTNLAKRGHS